MRDFPSCFGENGVQVADASCSSVGVSKASQNSVTCVYKCKLLNKSCFITIVWSKNLMGQCLSIEIDDASHEYVCKVDVKPSLFSKRKGSKSLQLNSSKVEVFWDLCSVKFGSGPEPVEGYYVAVVCRGEMVLVVGDLRKEAFKKTGAVASFSVPIFVSKREHIFGKRVFGTKVQFCDNGQIHDLKIECDSNCSNDPCLVVHIDAKRVMQVKHLQWKFRGNCAILVDGFQVEVFWDVHSWLFSTSLGPAVFMFLSSLSMEKLWAGESVSDSSLVSWSCSESLKEPKMPDLDFKRGLLELGRSPPFILWDWRADQLGLLIPGPRCIDPHPAFSYSSFALSALSNIFHEWIWNWVTSVAHRVCAVQECLLFLCYLSICIIYKNSGQRESKMCILKSQSSYHKVHIQSVIYS